MRFATVQAKQVSEMPLAGRNWINLLKVIPGATPTNTNALNGREYTATGYSDFKINGKAGNQTQVNLDGGSIVDQGSDAKTSVAPSLESIQEVSVLTNNFQAEYGTRGGTVINVVTKSGTNNFHATVFDYMRNEALNANSWANNYLGDQAPALPLQLLRRQPRRPDQEEQTVLLLQLRKVPAGHPGDHRPEPHAHRPGTQGRFLADRDQRRRPEAGDLHARHQPLRQSGPGSQQHPAGHR